MWNRGPAGDCIMRGYGIGPYLYALTRVDHSWVHGKRIVREGKLVGVNLETLIERVCSGSRQDR